MLKVNDSLENLPLDVHAKSESKTSDVTPGYGHVTLSRSPFAVNVDLRVSNDVSNYHKALTL